MSPAVPAEARRSPRVVSPRRPGLGSLHWSTLRPGGFPATSRRTGIAKKGHAFGKKAKQAGSALAFGKEVTLQTFGKDKYHRTIADVILPDGVNLN